MPWTVFGDGPATALRGPAAGGRGHVRGVPVFWDIPKDRLQDFQSLPGARARGPHRPLPEVLAMNSLQQQAGFDDFVAEFNHDRPHEALAMKTPADLYRAASRSYRGFPRSTIPCMTATPSSPPAGASECTGRKSTSRPSWPASAWASNDGIWVVSFMTYDLGYIDMEQKSKHPASTAGMIGGSARTLVPDSA